MSAAPRKPQHNGTAPDNPRLDSKGQASGKGRDPEAVRPVPEGRPYRWMEKGCFAEMDSQSGLILPRVILDEEFQRLLPVPTETEWQALEKEVAKEEACRDPVVVWKETLILLDRYPRLDVCRRLGIPYGITKLSFTDRESAKEWFLSRLTGQQPLPTPDFIISEIGLPTG